MKLFLIYIKEHRKTMLVFLMFSIIFVFSFLLYHLPVKAVIYPILLCVLSGIIIITCDFLNVHKRHNELIKIQELTAAMICELPNSCGIENSDYQTIIYNLKNENLKLQNDMNMRYDDMINYYTVWTHQIKTPIASIQLMLQNDDSSQSRKLMSEIRRIEQYTDMALAFLRLGSKSTDYIIKEYDLDTIILSCVKKFKTDFIIRKISLDYAPIYQTVITDEKWFSFVLEQVISNALKYTPEGGCIKIYLKGSDICIEDTGIGIAAADLPRIFEKGYTGYNGRSNKKATGIGLYLCKCVCGKLGHTIRAASQPDKGTLISIGIDQCRLNNE